MDPITPAGFMEIDFVLCSHEKPKMVFDRWTNRASTMQNHHFPTIVCLGIEFGKVHKAHNIRKDLLALRCTKMQDVFTT